MVPTLLITSLLGFLWTTPCAVLLDAGMSCKHHTRFRNRSPQLVVQVPSCILHLAILEATFYLVLTWGLLTSHPIVCINSHRDTDLL
jgi:hypothetical protein